jgi:hypothetical protein
LFKNPIIYFINPEISAERERSVAIVSAHHKQTKLRSMPIWNPVSEYQPEAVRHEQEISNAGRQKTDFAERDKCKPVLLRL